LNALPIIIVLLLITTPLVFAESSNVGIIYWDNEIISINSFADIYVKDDDMNKKEYPNFADKFTITVWSDTSPEGLEIPVVETGVYRGILKAVSTLPILESRQKIDCYLILVTFYMQNMWIPLFQMAELLRLFLLQL